MNSYWKLLVLNGPRTTRVGLMNGDMPLILFVGLGLLFNSRHDIFFRFVLPVIVFSIIWRNWLSKILFLSNPANILLPGLRRRLLVLSLLVWQISSMALALVMFNKLQQIMPLWFLTAAVTLILSYWGARPVLIVCGLAVLFCFVLAGVPQWAQELWVNPALNSMYLTGLILLLSSGLIAFRTILRNGAERHWQQLRQKERKSLASLISGWFLQRMMVNAEKRKLKGEPVGMAMFESRLNYLFGRQFHWSSVFVDLMNFWSWVGPYLWLVFLLLQMQSGMDGVPNFILFCIVGAIPGRFIVLHGSAIDRAKSEERSLIILAPGLPEDWPINQTLARISLRYFFMTWILSMPIFAGFLFLLHSPVWANSALVVGCGELALAGYIVRDYTNYNETSEWLRVFFTLLPIPLICWTPEHFLLSSAIPFIAAMILVMGGLFLRHRWKIICEAPMALPAGRLLETSS